MAGANSNIQLTSLDFDGIKQNFITYLQGQDTFKDYNFDGSAMSVLLDVLAYNTQYNSYYLNMVANEMFLDSSTQRSSVISHAKLLDYTPKSAIAPTATVNVTFNNVIDTSLTLPAYTHFISEAIDGLNYTFVTTDSMTINVSGSTATFEGVQIKQGIPVTQSFTYSLTGNPDAIFELPDSSIDTNTLHVVVQKSYHDTTTDIYNLADEVLLLDGTSNVYFLQENLKGNYEIYFGDGIIGKKLSDGNIVRVSYLSTEGKSAAGANSFTLMDTVSGYSATSTTSVIAATTGGNKETLSSIKFHAPKSYSAQGRAVTKEDYITAIQQNNAGFSFDAVNVWGGEENNPPVYGQVFCALKPTGSYTLTNAQKQLITDDILKPMSMMTVTPTIVDPDYTYLQLTVNVLYDPKKTTLTASQLQSAVKTAINNQAITSLNGFNSTFKEYEFNTAIFNTDKSILTSEISVKVQKKFYPILTTATTYNLNYGTSLQKGMFLSGISSNPAAQFRDTENLTTIIDGIYIEEVPSSSGGIQSITVLNPGFGYYHTPTVEILGDGTGATVEVVVNSTGTIRQINVINAGTGYTSAIVKITPSSLDAGAALASAVTILEGQYGTLRLYYNDTQNVKTVYNNSIGTVDYNNGIVTLNSFAPVQIDNDLGQLTVSATPTTSIISSTYNSIITVDPFDPNSIVVNVTAKT